MKSNFATSKRNSRIRSLVVRRAWRPAQRLHTQAEFRLSVETIRMARMGYGCYFSAANPPASQFTLPIVGRGGMRNCVSRPITTVEPDKFPEFLVGPPFYCVTVNTPELTAAPPGVVIAIFPVFAPIGT